MLTSHCEHTSVPKDELLWGHRKPNKTYYWQTLKDFSSGWKEFCTLAGNQCFLILIRPVATSAIDIPTPGKISFKVPITAAILLLRNLGIPTADGVPLVVLVPAASGCLMKGKFPCSDLLLTISIRSALKKLTSVCKVLLWVSCSVCAKSFDTSSICTSAEMGSGDLHCQSPRTTQRPPPLCILAKHIWSHWEIFYLYLKCWEGNRLILVVVWVRMFLCTHTGLSQKHSHYSLNTNTGKLMPVKSRKRRERLWRGCLFWKKA